MIINHQYKFLFVHIHKTAGSSIRNSLLRHVPGSYFFGYEHTFINAIPDLSLYKDYFKFCIVRNPYSRLVSWYHSILELKSNTNSLKNYVIANSNNFSQFLDCTDIIYEQNNDRMAKISNNNQLLSQFPNLAYPKSISFNQIDYITDKDGSVAMDYIGRFESLNTSWREICNKLSLNIPLYYYKVGSYHDDTKKNYQDYYTTIDKQKITTLYQKDLNYFNDYNTK